MPNRTDIEWTDYASNPLRAERIDNGKVGWACTRVSPGCDHCYSEAINRRFGTALAYTSENESKIRFIINEKELESLRAFKKEHVRVFVCDMTDIFHRQVSNEMLGRLFDVFEATPHFTKQILTKRPERMRLYLSKRWAGRRPPPHIWLGVSVERQQEVFRVSQLIQTPAAIRFLSVEPLMGPIEFSDVTRRADAVLQIGKKALDGIHWVIVGGESGSGARECNLAWIDSIVSQCSAVEVPVFVKQLGAKPFYRDEDGAKVLVNVQDKKGGDIRDFPCHFHRQQPAIAVTNGANQ